MLKPEPGKAYKTRHGERAVIYGRRGKKDFPLSGRLLLSTSDLYWAEDGHYGELGDHPHDLISEWQDEKPTGPVRTVTRKEIVPGVYGKVTVGDFGFGCSLSVKIGWDGGGGAYLQAQELREAAKVLNELASALEENASA